MSPQRLNTSGSSFLRECKSGPSLLVLTNPQVRLENDSGVAILQQASGSCFGDREAGSESRDNSVPSSRDSGSITTVSPWSIHGDEWPVAAQTLTGPKGLSRPGTRARSSSRCSLSLPPSQKLSTSDKEADAASSGRRRLRWHSASAIESCLVPPLTIRKVQRQLERFDKEAGTLFSDSLLIAPHAPTLVEGESRGPGIARRTGLKRSRGRLM